MCIGMLLLLCVQRLLCVVQPYTCIITRSVISPRCTLVRRRGPHRMPHKPTSQKKKTIVRQHCHNDAAILQSPWLQRQRKEKEKKRRQIRTLRQAASEVRRGGGGYGGGRAGRLAGGN
ncbi:hypothetical protein JOL62DRAFT_161980 [Phyllosticta paracitricarpa]|uniref:Secreted protein n=1 Tax=Phyllosticta paracitricarpa TaxID=2016321 RepID=A0ABR1N2U2_9PEZI